MSGYPRSPPYDYDGEYRRHSTRYTSEKYAAPDPYGNGYSTRDAYAREAHGSYPPSSYVRSTRERSRDEASYYRPEPPRYAKPERPLRRADPDEQLHTRLFVVHGSSSTEEELRKTFEKWGTVKDIRMVRKRGDKDTLTGISFISYSKASEAAKAIDEVNGKVLSSSPKPIKVMVATRYGAGKDSVSEEELLRLFIKIPVDYSETEIKEHFTKFGPLEYVNFVHDKVTSKPKGVAYVKFFRFYEAARACEESDMIFRAVFAESREPPNHMKGPRDGPGYTVTHRPGTNDRADHGPPINVAPNYALMGAEYLPNSRAGLLGLLPPQVAHPIPDPEATCCLRLHCAKEIDERLLTFLCDIVPGFKRCDVTAPGVANVLFNSFNWSQYAHEKLNGFEYPPGCRIVAKFIPDPWGSSKASDVPFYPCSIEMPSKKPVVHAPAVDAVTGRAYKARLFIICSPRALAGQVLEDVFCRFGHLIDVYTLPGKTIGYAKFDSVEAAEDCREMLNGADIAGCKLKVIEADEEKGEKPHDGGSDAKRRKT